MARALILADTQIGVQSVDLADQQAVLERIVAVALEREVDVVIHGGDVFEGPAATPEHLRVFLDAVEPLRHAGIPLLVLKGNGRHDSATRSVHALDIFNDVPMIEVHDRPGITAHGGIGIVTLPWVSPGNLIAQWGGDVDHDQVNDYAGKLLVEIAASELGRLRGSRFVHDSEILVCHWAISGSKLPTGLAVDQMREPILSWADLDVLGFDAIIGAHVHEPQHLSRPGIDRTLGFVVGSPQQLNFGEHGEHGCWIVGVGDGPERARAEFVPVPSKQFVTLDADLTGEDETSGLAYVDLGYDANAHIDAITDGAMVRCRVKATEDQWRRVDQSTLRANLLAMGASRVAFDPHVVQKSRARSEQISDTLTPVDALTAFCESEQTASAMRERMVATLREWSEA